MSRKPDFDPRLHLLDYVDSDGGENVEVSFVGGGGREDVGASSSLLHDLDVATRLHLRLREEDADEELARVLRDQELAESLARSDDNYGANERMARQLEREEMERRARELKSPEATERDRRLAIDLEHRSRREAAERDREMALRMQSEEDERVVHRYDPRREAEELRRLQEKEDERLARNLMEAERAEANNNNNNTNTNNDRPSPKVEHDDVDDGRGTANGDSAHVNGSKNSNADVNRGHHAHGGDEDNEYRPTIAAKPPRPKTAAMPPESKPPSSSKPTRARSSDPTRARSSEPTRAKSSERTRTSSGRPSEDERSSSTTGAGGSSDAAAARARSRRRSSRTGSTATTPSTSDPPVAAAAAGGVARRRTSDTDGAPPLRVLRTHSNAGASVRNDDRSEVAAAATPKPKTPEPKTPTRRKKGNNFLKRLGLGGHGSSSSSTPTAPASGGRNRQRQNGNSGGGTTANRSGGDRPPNSSSRRDAGGNASSGARRTAVCDACGKPTSHYLVALGKKFHIKCFTCMGCGDLIDPQESFAYTTNEHGSKFPLHRKCHAELFGMKCTVCGDSIPYSDDDGTITYVKHPFFSSEQMCPRHAVPQEEGDVVPRRCTGCHRFEPQSGPGFADLHDGDRCVCYSCCRTVVVDSAEARPLWEKVINFFDNVLHITIWEGLRKVPVLIVGYETLNESSRASHHNVSSQIMTRGLCLSEHQSNVRSIRLHNLRFDRNNRSFAPGDGDNNGDEVEDRGFTYFNVPDASKANPDSRVTAILCLSGLPSDLTASVLAHEATHAWFKLHPRFNIQKPIPLMVEEGCCQLMAMLFLTDGLDDPRSSPRQEDEGGPSDAQLRQYFKFSIETDENEIYGTGFRLAAKAYAKIGIEALLSHVVMYREFPEV